ncbi:MAG: universal stress protein, partial [Micromonosporaceae bacterium]|nr:universal stress protein [Micromonosporaceae bacterium]
MTTPADSPPAASAAVERYGPRWVPPPFERGTDGPRVILVGVDGSDTSMRAAAYACGLARRQRCHLVVAYVIAPSAFAWAIPGAGALLQSTLDEVEADLRREIRRLAEEARIPVSFLSRRGSPYPCLREMADEVKADIVVVGASAHRGHRLVGSIGTRLVRLG